MTFLYIVPCPQFLDEAQWLDATFDGKMEDTLAYDGIQLTLILITFEDDFKW